MWFLNYVTLILGCNRPKCTCSLGWSLLSSPRRVAVHLEGRNTGSFPKMVADSFAQLRPKVCSKLWCMYKSLKISEPKQHRVYVIWQLFMTNLPDHQRMLKTHTIIFCDQTWYTHTHKKKSQFWLWNFANVHLNYCTISLNKVQPYIKVIVVKNILSWSEVHSSSIVIIIVVFRKNREKCKGIH